jgi:hypothetical protein
MQPGRTDWSNLWMGVDGESKEEPKAQTLLSPASYVAQGKLPSLNPPRESQNTASLRTKTNFF